MFTDLHEIAETFERLEGQTAGLNLQDFLVSTPRDLEYHREWKRRNRKLNPASKQADREARRRRRAADPGCYARGWSKEKEKLARDPEAAARKLEYKRKWAAAKRLQRKSSDNGRAVDGASESSAKAHT